jgi:ssDNA-binding Zn-finger/Zn-ribbon topoisomerase 1
MIQPTLRTCPECGSKKRRWLNTITERFGRRMVVRTAIVQCYSAGCGATRWVQLTP